MGDIFSFNEEEMDRTVGLGKKSSDSIEDSNAALRGNFNQIRDDDGGEIATNFNNYTEELNREIDISLQSLRDADDALQGSRKTFSEAKDIVKNQIAGR